MIMGSFFQIIIFVNRLRLMSNGHSLVLPFERTPFFYCSDRTRDRAYPLPHLLYLNIQILHEFEICTRNTTCEMLTIGDNID